MPNTINEVSCTSTKTVIDLSDMLEFINLGCSLHPTGDFEVSDLMTRCTNTRIRQVCYNLQRSNQYYYHYTVSLTFNDLLFYYLSKVIGNVYIDNAPSNTAPNSTLKLTACQQMMIQAGILMNYESNDRMDEAGVQRATVLMLNIDMPALIPGISRLVKILKDFKGSDRISRIMEGLIDGMEIFDIRIKPDMTHCNFSVNRAIVGLGEALKHNPVFGHEVQDDEQCDGTTENDSAQDCGE